MKNVKKKNLKKKKKKRGFTLIELLAVIIILGVLMIIAIPSVTEYIQSSRKNAYASTATNYVNGARTKINSAEVPMFDTTATYYLPTSCISLEKGGDSPFGELEEGYVVVENQFGKSAAQANETEITFKFNKWSQKLRLNIRGQVYEYTRFAELFGIVTLITEDEEGNTTVRLCSGFKEDTPYFFYIK